MSPPWMPLYIADYLRDTAHLRAAESGAYLHLIMAYWANGKLPNNDRQLATIAKMTDQEWAEHKDTLAAFFGPDWASHKRIDQELAEALEKIEKKSAAGRTGGIASGAARSKSEATVQRSFNCRSTVVEAKAKQTATQPQPHTHIEKIEGADAPPRARSKDRKRATRFPEGMTANRAAQEAAGLSVAEGEREFTKFRNHASEKGRTCVDWDAAERNWYLKAAEFMGRKPISAVVSGPATPDEFAVKYFKNSGRWNVAYGPEPGKPGCRASPEILEKYGYKPKEAA